jgi:ABC-type amino acid transport substrate-binding protein
MAASPQRIIVFTLTAALTVWMWALVVVLFSIRWNAVERPGPPAREIFPYGELRVGVDPSYPPFAVATADDLYGLDIDLARAIGERLDLPVRFVLLGYDGLYDALKVDQVDVLISALLIDPSRRNDVLYTAPYFNAGLVLVSTAGSPFVSMEAMPGRSVAYEFGSSAEAEARKWLRRVLPFETRPYELASYALDAARLGEADAAMVDAITARLYRREHSEWRTQMASVNETWYAIAARSDRGAAWNAVNYALESMRADGTLDAILARWL